MLDYTQKSHSENDHLNIWHSLAMKNFDFKGQRVLDIGCGTGLFLNRIRALGAEVIGVDPNAMNGSFLKERNIPFLQGFLDDYVNSKEILEFAPNVITCFEVIEHIYDPHPLLKSISTILKRCTSGSRIIISTPNAFNIMRAIDFLVLQKHRDPLMDPVINRGAEHIRAYSVRMVKDLVKMHGFKVHRKDVWRGYGLGQYLSSNIVVSGTFE